MSGQSIGVRFKGLLSNRFGRRMAARRRKRFLQATLRARKTPKRPCDDRAQPRPRFEQPHDTANQSTGPANHRRTSNARSAQ